MTRHEVAIAKMKPDDPQADRLMDMYEAETHNAPHEITKMTRLYKLDGRSMHAVKRQLAADLREVGGDTWQGHVSISRADNHL